MACATTVGSLFLALLVMVEMLTDAEAERSGKVLLVSMDGFRWDYIRQVSGLGNFSRLEKEGSSVQFVNNTFVTKTFPCHYTIVTGLYEESHGIVANSMYDPERNASFTMTSKEPFWWNGGEPIWVTAEKQQKKSAVFFWPGSEAEIRGYRPSIFKAYNQSVPFTERVEGAISWFLHNATDFVALYFEEPDSTGHQYGPDSPQVADEVRKMDGILGLILDSLERASLKDVVNVIITSDHGMTEVNMQDKLLDLWQYINHSMIERVPDSDVVNAILPREGYVDEVLIAAMKIPHAKAYRREEIPDRFHYKHNPRIMPIIVISDEGWTIAANYNASSRSNLRGNHGYSNEHLSMKPIFFALGPDFRKGVKSTSIRSVDIYPLLCHLLNIQPALNNGSLAQTAHFLVGGTSLAAHCVVSSCILMVMVLLAYLL